MTIDLSRTDVVPGNNVVSAAQAHLAAGGGVHTDIHVRGSAAMAAESSGCEDTRPAADGEALFTRAKETAQAQFRRDIAPYYVTREITLMDTGDGITAPEAKEKLKQGIAYAGKGRLDMACELWGAARILSPDAVAIQYNLGVCAESAGDLDAAQTLYAKADNLLGKPDEDITQALSRVAEGIKKRDRLKKQLTKN